MKKQYLVSILALCAFIMVSKTTLAQMPLPCVEYTNDNVTTLYGFHGSKSVGCLEINMEETPIHMNDNDVRDYQVQNASIKPGYSYVPSGGDGRFSITLGEREEMEGAWFEPINYFPQLYEKIEWGLKLPSEVEQAIDNWIDNDQNGTEHYPALNPFDPEQIDVKAIVDYTDENGNYHSQPVFGFFYRDYQRITVYNNPYSEDMDDPDNWRWDEIPTEYRFRFRWASDVIAHHSVRLTVNVPSMGYWELSPFEFDSYWGDPRNSFISVTQNGHYFKTVDNHVFFPVGLNINEGTFGCSCMEGVEDTWQELTPEDCELCYGVNNPVFNSTNAFNPCCGIRKNKRKRGHYISPEQIFDENGLPIFDSGLIVQSYTLPPAAYLKLEQVLRTLKENGANSFRTIIDPTTYDIEFEKLNNYFDRQYQAWEFDQVLNHCNDLDLRVELNMLMHYAIMYHAYGADKFDWDNTYNSGGIDPGTSGTLGYCYWRELGLDTPLDFLTNPAAISNYKKKMRYMIARWGYSKNIFLLELVSEMNNIGKNDAITGDLARSLYDRLPEVTRPAVAAWHNEIASYIKQDLSHTRHLIAADYTGTAPMASVEFNSNMTPLDLLAECNACQTTFFDESWHSSNIDVIAWNNYSDALNRWEKSSVLEYKKEENQTDGLLCGWDNPDEDCISAPPLYSALGSYESIWKPVVYPEAGAACLGEDYTGFVKDLLVGIFSGHATSGMSWDEWSSTEHWYIMGEVAEFLETNILNDVNLGSERWLPNHSYSSSDNLQDESQLAEAIYLHFENEFNSKYTGVIINRTWNHYTQCDCSLTVDEPLSVFTTYGWSSHKIRLKDAGTHNYTIRYFDPFTKHKLNEVNRFSSLNRLGLEDYPILGHGVDGHQPFYFFEAFIEGTEFNESPTSNAPEGEIYRQGLDSNTFMSDTGTAIIEKTETDFLYVYPNPTNDCPMIEFSSSLIGNEAIVYSISGQKVWSFQFESNSPKLMEFQIDAGLYTIYCPAKELRVTFVKI